MNGYTKQDILDAIRRTGRANSGVPLGEKRFLKETGINSYDWGKFWARFGDAQKEAGFTPNQLEAGYSDEFLIEQLIALIRKLGKFPTVREIRVEHSNHDTFPSRSAYYRLGNKEQLVAKVLEYCAQKNGHDDIVHICESTIKHPDKVEQRDTSGHDVFEVYLMKSGKYYKIGRTKDSVRRGSELRIQLPQKNELIHSIKTDDPSGIEAYWHRRFEAKRMQGEWFDLSPADVKAFKRWKKII